MLKSAKISKALDVFLLLQFQTFTPLAFETAGDSREMLVKRKLIYMYELIQPHSKLESSRSVICLVSSSS